MAISVSLILLFLGIGVLVLIHVCVVGRTVGREINEPRNVHVEEGGSTSMSLDDIEKLPCFDFKAKGGSSPPSDCAVCLESFRDGERCRLLPLCGHCFHAMCVDLWLIKVPVCPICRTEADSVIKNGEEGDGLGDLGADEEGGVSGSSNGDGVLDSSERVVEVREREEN